MPSIARAEARAYPQTLYRSSSADNQSFRCRPEDVRSRAKDELLTIGSYLDG
jgi:hypothetical protein